MVRLIVVLLDVEAQGLLGRKYMLSSRLVQFVVAMVSCPYGDFEVNITQSKLWIYKLRRVLRTQSLALSKHSKTLETTT